MRVSTAKLIVGWLIAIVVMAVVAVTLIGQIMVSGIAGDPSAKPAPAAPAAPAEPAPTVSETNDYVVRTGAAQINYKPSKPGVVEYCPLDGLGRAVCAYGELTASLRDAAKNTGRQDITVDPSGWPSDNGESLIPALPGVAGSKDYNGWFWNRSHLVADSLGGDALVVNLVTGTRTQNVGSVQISGQYSGGMARTELIARDYLDSQRDDSCPLYYAATPRYSGDELIPRTVQIDIRSCDATIDASYEVSNTANGWSIDYSTGMRERTP